MAKFTLNYTFEYDVEIDVEANDLETAKWLVTEEMLKKHGRESSWSDYTLTDHYVLEEDGKCR